ncbi:MAG TPA: hypothetical protein VN728_15870 [Stellaceae bacterium]|jgi:hypothetical protein|nr:hypothetical protein [Stellaceae bacterium]
MAGLNLSERVLAELDLGNIVIPVGERRPVRWELWMSFTAAVSVILVVVAGLLILIAELRAGWVPGHELPMDKTTAIHNLLFRS